MSSLFLMQSVDVFVYGPFAIHGVVHGEQEAFAYNGRLFCKIADTEELALPKTISEVGDVASILLSLCWSDRTQTALKGIRWASTIRTREIDIWNSDSLWLDTFTWAADFGRYDVLDRQRSHFSVISGTDAIMSVHEAVIDAKRIPPFDIWGSMYGGGFFVTSDVKARLTTSGCIGFAFKPVGVS